MFELSFNQVMKYMGTTLVLQDLNFQVYAGERVGTVGSNGCGKSTILKMIAQTFKGNYSAYVEQKDEQMRIQYEDFRAQQKKIQSIEKSVRELREWALKAIDVYKSFEEKVIFNGANLMVEYGERVGFIGPNGSGKTTFLKMLLGEVGADSGKLILGANAKVAYLPQAIQFINEEHTVLECFRDEVIIGEGKAREYLSKYMFYGKRVFTKVSALSGGERIRLKLAKLLFEEVNLLILDEPTNHLDIDSIETFEEALSAFNGTIFFISHDRYFINKISERIIAIEDGYFNTYIGNYDQYKDSI